MNRYLRILKNRFNMLLGKIYALDFVYLDTTGACTNRCYMCPARIAVTKRNYMSDEVFEKVIDELVKNNYSGGLHFYGQDEPLLDKNLFERIDFAHERLLVCLQVR